MPLLELLTYFGARRLQNDYQAQQDQSAQRQRETMDTLRDIHGQTMAQEQRLHDDLMARQDAADRLQAKHQEELERRTELTDQYKDVASKVGSIVERDFSVLGAYLDNYNKDLENAHAIELGLDAPHATTELSQDLSVTRDMRWLDSGPDFDAEERDFQREDREISQNDRHDLNSNYQARESAAAHQSPRLSQIRVTS